MFKNPLKKYQQGGQVSQEQQQMLAAFVEWLPKRVKEFQGMQPEQIVEALNGMTKSPEGQKQVQAYMQQFQQEMQNPQAGMFENGGKLQDFICKHAKGGHVAGCGCKEDGGKVEKAEDGYKVKNGSYEASVKAPGDTTRSKQYNYTTENMRTYPTGAVRYQTTSNNDGYTTTSWDYRKTMPTFWQRVGSEGFLSAMLNRPRRVSPTTKENWENIIANHPEDPRNALKKEDGGVVKGQNSIPGGMPGPDPSTITYSDSPYARAEGRTNEMIITPQGHVTLLTSPSSVGERRDSLFLVRPEDMFGKSTEAERRYRSFFKFKDNEHYPNGAAGNFDNIRAWWEAYKARAGKNVSY